MSVEVYAQQQHSQEVVELRQHIARLQDIAIQHRRTKETLRALVEGTATAIGDDFFRSLVRNLAAALQVRHAFVAEFAGSDSRVRTLAFWSDGAFLDRVEFDLPGTPCEQVLCGQSQHYPEGVQQLFPRDAALTTLEAESYLAIPLRTPAGTIVGHLAVIDTKPMPLEAIDLSIFHAFAARAGAELDRKRTETTLNRMQLENLQLQDEIHAEHNFNEIIGTSAAMQKVFAQIEQVASTDATVLITGETGTGKELIARALHNRSARREQPLIKVNCTALPTTLIESELFGHEKGAFTGALARKIGRFELADGGTLFLDEIGDVSLEVQVKLLRVLQEHEFERVGGTQTLTSDVRVIAATNRDLKQAVAEQTFRADLYYRLNVFPLPLPPLRDRDDDIALLVRHFVNKHTRKLGKQITHIAPETLHQLTSYTWPGNIRELEHVIERAVIRSSGSTLEVAEEFMSTPTVTCTTDQQLRSLAEVEREYIMHILDRTRGVVEGPKGAATVLQLHPNTLRGRMRKLGITLGVQRRDIV